MSIGLRQKEKRRLQAPVLVISESKPVKRVKINRVKINRVKIIQNCEDAVNDDVVNAA